MYEFDAPAVYAHESVIADARCRVRMEKVISALTHPREPKVFTDENILSLIGQDKFFSGCNRAMGTLEQIPDPVIVFNKFKFSDIAREQLKPLKEKLLKITDAQRALALTGDGAFDWACYNLPEDPDRNDKVCRPCWRIHFQAGCLHKCHYCGFGGVLITMTNAEDYILQLGRLMQAHPWQETFLLEDDADVLCLEPELDCTGPIIEFFGTLKDRYLILHTKSWNTDWMYGLKHNGKTIIVWSIAGPAQSRDIEPKTGLTEQRLAAARKCQDAGYTVRYKFKPIIPVEGWREEASGTIEQVFKKTKPDVISLCCFMWMGIDDLKKKLAKHRMDPVFIKAAEDAREETKNTTSKPFPEWVRAEIYEYYLNEIRKYNREIPVSLSTETWSMWSRIGKKFGFTATNYVCGCGPNSIPNRKILLAHPYTQAKRNGSWIK